MKPQLLVITGNPVDGLYYHGPFEDADHASNFCDAELDNTDYWVVQMKLPAPFQYQLLEDVDGTYWLKRDLTRGHYFTSLEAALEDAWRHYKRSQTYMGALPREAREDVAKKLKYLGEFASKLYDAWQHADMSNRAAIELAFDHLFQKADREY